MQASFISLNGHLSRRLVLTRTYFWNPLSVPTSNENKLTWVHRNGSQKVDKEVNVVPFDACVLLLNILYPTKAQHTKRWITFLPPALKLCKNFFHVTKFSNFLDKKIFYWYIFICFLRCCSTLKIGRKSTLKFALWIYAHFFWTGPFLYTHRIDLNLTLLRITTRRISRLDRHPSSFSRQVMLSSKKSVMKCAWALNSTINIFCIRSSRNSPITSWMQIDHLERNCTVSVKCPLNFMPDKGENTQQTSKL